MSVYFIEYSTGFFRALLLEDQHANLVLANLAFRRRAALAAAGGFALLAGTYLARPALVADLTAELAARDCPLPVVLGNRNTAPFVDDAFDELIAGGARRVLVIPTSAWRSYSSCRQYREGLAVAAEGREGLVLDKIRPFGEHPGFAATFARDTLAGAREAVAAAGAESVALLFITHSIPDAMDETSGPGDGEGRAHSTDQATLAAEIVAEPLRVWGPKNRNEQWTKVRRLLDAVAVT